MFATPESEAATLKEATAFAVEYNFTAIPTLHYGIHSGRQRYKIICNTCGETVHHATTGPVELMKMHLRKGKCDPFPTVWLPCSPDLLNAGCNCAATPRKAGPAMVGHHHLVDLSWAIQNNMISCACGHTQKHHLSRGSQCDYGSRSDPHPLHYPPCDCTKFRPQKD